MLISHTKEVPKKYYDEAKARYDHEQSRYYLSDEQEEELFSESIRWGYGLYGAEVYEKDGKYYCDYITGDSCD